MNVSLFSGRDNTTLVDTGTCLTVRRLKKEMARLGLTFADITHIVLTHGHMDHQGAVRTIAKHCGKQLRVCAHHDEIEAIQAGGNAPLKAYRRFLELTGTPPPLRLAILVMFFCTKRMTRACRER